MDDAAGSRFVGSRFGNPLSFFEGHASPRGCEASNPRTANPRTREPAIYFTPRNFTSTSRPASQVSLFRVKK